MIKGNRVLLVIAHPDDESMFFAPTLHALGCKQAETRVLCLSNGESTALGAALHSVQHCTPHQPASNCFAAAVPVTPSAGNGAGLGKVREKELVKAAAVFQVSHISGESQPHLSRQHQCIQRTACPGQPTHTTTPCVLLQVPAANVEIVNDAQLQVRTAHTR